MPEPPKPIQLVLQGGGAKIFALIAAVDALHDAELKHKIKITRIAGTSAGAIVGSLYAAGIDPKTIREAFMGFPLDQLVRFEGTWGKGAALLRALRSVPLADDRGLAALLDRLLRDQGVSFLRDLKSIPMLIVASDVSGRQRLVYDSQGDGRDRNLVSCILDSCAIPFFFRAAGKDSQTLILDGGLCENLASELLTPGTSTHGDVVAISFTDEAPSTPRSPRELAIAILDTAISAAVRRSKLLGNLFLIELDPYGIGTFDFSKAWHALRPKSSEYDNAKMRTAQRIEELYSAQGHRRVSQNRWDSSDLTTMHQLFKVYKSQQSNRVFSYLSRRLVIEANSLLQEGEEGHGTRDLVVQMIEFSPSREPIDCIAARIFTDPGERPSDVSCDVYDVERKPVPFQPIPVRDLDDPSMYGLLIYFTPPLEPAMGAKYFLKTEFRVGHAFPDLLSGKDDYMESRILRTDGVVPRIELVAQIPKSFGQIVGASCPAPYFPAQPMSQQDLWDSARSTQFQAYGWVAADVPNGQAVKIDLRSAP